SQGRVQLSIASGWHPNDFVLAPGDFENRHQIMREKIDTLQHLWQGGSITRKNGVGKDFEFKIHPRPIQKKLPLWITAAGGEETFRYAGTIGANVLTHLMRHTIEELGAKIKVYRDALQENGFDPNEGKVALMLHTFVSDDESYVRETVEKPFKDYLRNSVNLLSPIAADQGLSVEDDMDTLLEMGFRRYYKTSSLFGTPESCLDILKKLHAIEVNEIACLIDFGVDKELVLENMTHLHRLQELIKRSKLQYDFMSGRMQLLDADQSSKSLIQKHEVTHLQSTPSFYEELLAQEGGDEALKQLDTLLVGGEALKQSLANRLLTTTERPLHNMYGPTETTIWSAVKTIKDQSPVTIGSPIANTQIYLLDANDQLTPFGVPGELCIGGNGVSNGYINNTELTQSRFVTNPFREGERIYKTGDLARWLPNGELEFLGRLDTQVKIKGHRIELKEIENVIMEMEAIEQAVVTTTDVQESPLLVAYIKAPELREVEVVKDYLRSKLPNYMIPHHITKIAEFPLTPNGKIDVKQLSFSEATKAAERKHVAPRNKMERQLAKIWSDFLQLETLSIDDNFFEIGGNSMKAFQLLSVLNSTLHLELKIIAFFQFPTVRTLAQSISTQLQRNEVAVEENEMENVDDLIDFMTDM
ncbi:MAG: MupA/Atu3671 family FMN-dependent luciferase-like monooxygenase, partial [Bacteroidota bacterium]